MKDYVDCIMVCEQWQRKSVMADTIGRQYEKTITNMSKHVKSVRNLEVSTIYHHKSYKELFPLGRLLNGEWIYSTHSP